VTNVAFSPDGDRIVVCSVSGDRYFYLVMAFEASTGFPDDFLMEIARPPDMEVIAAGPLQCPLRAVPRHEETSVERADGGQPVASFPISLHSITTHANGRTWAGASGNHVYIVTLEGEPPPVAEPPEQR